MIQHYDSNSVQTAAPVVRIYACGGAGINLGSSIEEAYRSSTVEDRAGHVEPDVIYADSSRMNMGRLRADARTYVLRARPNLLESAQGEELRGGGGDRAFLQPLAEEAAPEIVRKYPPTAGYNVVIFSAHGASGPTIGMQIYRELLRQKRHVIIIVVGGAHGVHRVQTTTTVQKALLKYQAEQNWSAGIFYMENPGLLPADEAVVNRAVLEFWAGVSTVLAGVASRLDQRDVENWLQLPGSLRMEKALYLIKACLTEDDLAASKNVVSVVGAVCPEVKISPAAQQVLESALYAKLGVFDGPAPQLNAVFLVAEQITDDWLRGVVTSANAVKSALEATALPSATTRTIIGTIVTDEDVF